MTAQPPDTTPQLPANPPKVSVLTLIGVVVFFAGAVVARLIHNPDDLSAGADVGDTIKALGMLLASFGGPLPIPEILRRVLGSGGAKLLMGLLVGGLLVGGSMVVPGCGTVRIDSPEPVALSVDSGPPCAIVAQDHAGETVLSFTAPGTCDPQVSRRWLCRRWRAALGPGEVQPLACAGVQP